MLINNCKTSRDEYEEWRKESNKYSTFNKKNENENFFTPKTYQTILYSILIIGALLIFICL
jgi:hypothetical protein